MDGWMDRYRLIGICIDRYIDTLYICMHIYVHLYTCTHINICIHVHLRVYICMYIGT